MDHCSSSLDINTSGHDSRLLSLESPILSSGRTGPGGQDLSLSELSISDHTAIMPKPFSLLAKVDLDPATPTRNNEAINPEIHSDEHENDDSDLLNDEADEEAEKQAEKRKEEKLHSDIFILKKLNASFELFNDALQETGSANQRIAVQLEQTDALLNKYISILSTSEDFARLLFDEQWQGAEADEEAVERERTEAEERRRREAEAVRAQQEILRLEKERQGALEREEKERVEREKSERAIRGGIRGVRGTRASMRGMRGSVPPRSDSAAGTSRGIPRPRPTSGISRPSRPI